MLPPASMPATRALIDHLASLTAAPVLEAPRSLSSASTQSPPVSAHERDGDNTVAGNVSAPLAGTDAWESAWHSRPRTQIDKHYAALLERAKAQAVDGASQAADAGDAPTSLHAGRRLTGTPEVSSTLVGGVAVNYMRVRTAAGQGDGAALPARRSIELAFSSIPVSTSRVCRPGTPSNDLAASAPIAIAVSDGAICSIHYVSCDGAAQLAYTGASSCLPCSLFRSNEWQAASGAHAAVPTAAATATPGAAATGSGGVIAAAGGEDARWPFASPNTTSPALQVVVLLGSAILCACAILFAQRWRAQRPASRGYQTVSVGAEDAGDSTQDGAVARPESGHGDGRRPASAPAATAHAARDAVSGPSSGV